MSIADLHHEHTSTCSLCYFMSRTRYSHYVKARHDKVLAYITSRVLKIIKEFEHETVLLTLTSSLHSQP